MLLSCWVPVPSTMVALSLGPCMSWALFLEILNDISFYSSLFCSSPDVSCRALTAPLLLSRSSSPCRPSGDSCLLSEASPSLLHVEQREPLLSSSVMLSNKLRNPFCIKHRQCVYRATSLSSIFWASAFKRLISCETCISIEFPWWSLCTGWSRCLAWIFKANR